MFNFALVGPGVGVDAAIGSISWSLMKGFIYFLALFIAFRASFSLNFLNFWHEDLKMKAPSETSL